MSGHICPWWFSYTFDNPLRRFFHNPEKILGPYVAEGMTVLDVGCGMGFFSIGLAKLVGNKGCVIAVDVQQEMLNALEKRAEKAGVFHRIRIHRCESNKLGVEGPVDFILAFWMLHEVPDLNLFLHQARSCLKPNGKMLISEPKFHVSSKRFREILVSAEKSGLKQCEALCLRFSRSAVLENVYSPESRNQKSRGFIL